MLPPKIAALYVEMDKVRGRSLLEAVREEWAWNF
jgi:hypothetical protein